MFVEERHAEILRLLDENDKVRVKDLSERFQVTEDCIRKDLSILEEKNLLKKAYGGAVKVKTVLHETKVERRRDKNIKEKRAIAKKAAKLVEDGDIIFLDISTTNIEVAKELLKQDKNITVVTNMLDIANVFGGAIDTKIEFILIGGTFNRGQDGFLGGMTIETLQKFNFTKSFVGVVGANVEKNSITTYAMEDGICKTSIIKSSKKVYLVMETMKFNLDVNYKYAVFEDVNGVICEKRPNDNMVEQLNSYGVELY